MVVLKSLISRGHWLVVTPRLQLVHIAISTVYALVSPTLTFIVCVTSIQARVLLTGYGHLKCEDQRLSFVCRHKSKAS